MAMRIRFIISFLLISWKESVIGPECANRVFSAFGIANRYSASMLAFGTAFRAFVAPMGRAYHVPVVFRLRGAIVFSIASEL
ncbi:hypothetical protein BG74_09280 [Sodalis-like endosymbiont of Proechinophthirus fluctus]|nr:hypothetical protein BG74_09280 [Sodalis-like endosymbiont of Proechinophthirus fluctus]